MRSNIYLVALLSTVYAAPIAMLKSTGLQRREASDDGVATYEAPEKSYDSPKSYSKPEETETENEEETDVASKDEKSYEKPSDVKSEDEQKGYEAPGGVEGEEESYQKPNLTESEKKDLDKALDPKTKLTNLKVDMPVLTKMIDSVQNVNSTIDIQEAYGLYKKTIKDNKLLTEAEDHFKKDNPELHKIYLDFVPWLEKAYGKQISVGDALSGFVKYSKKHEQHIEAFTKALLDCMEVHPQLLTEVLGFVIELLKQERKYAVKGMTILGEIAQNNHEDLLYLLQMSSKISGKFGEAFQKLYSAQG